MWAINSLAKQGRMGVQQYDDEVSNQHILDPKSPFGWRSGKVGGWKISGRIENI